MNKIVSINRDDCIGCGLCAEICPEIFRMAEDGLAEVYFIPDETINDKVDEASKSCPVGVIEIKN